MIIGDSAVARRGATVLRSGAARVVEDAEVGPLAEVVADLGDHDVAAALLVLVRVLEASDDVPQLIFDDRAERGDGGIV